MLYDAVDHPRYDAMPMIRKGCGKLVRRVQWRQSVRPLGAYVFLLFVPRFMYRPAI
jgi:hypothetical protein